MCLGNFRKRNNGNTVTGSFWHLILKQDTAGVEENAAATGNTADIRKHSRQQETQQTTGNIAENMKYRS
jgi:hypothetical protein